MKKTLWIVTLCWLCFMQAARASVKLSYQVSFEPQSKYIIVNLKVSELNNPSTLFKMPVWAPGYYLILDYPKNMTDFRVTDGEGQEIRWQKEGKNAWRIYNGKQEDVNISYRIFANNQSVAEAKITEEKAFLPGNGIYLYVDNEKESAVQVSFSLPEGWTQIVTGLDLVDKTTNTYQASNIDVLYDCPTYIGNPEIVNFTLDGKEYELSMETPEGYQETTFVDDLKKMIRTTTRMMGHVPYEHYHFILMGKGGGGLEHLNSQACFTNGWFFFEDRYRYLNFLSFITHEYFHLYNVKTIRPIEFGPFDYDREVFSPMLWISEGFTVYYESRLLHSAGLISDEEFLRDMSGHIRTVESKEGHRHMSLRESSYDIWLHFFNRNANRNDVIISYYDKGPILGLLMDIEIRRLTDNRKSLDDVMRALYYNYHIDQNRGFTEEEFWQTCADVAGSPLEEMRRYVDTTCEIDYERYLSYAGLQMDENFQLTKRPQAEGKVNLFKEIPLQ